MYNHIPGIISGLVYWFQLRTVLYYIYLVGEETDPKYSAAV